MLKVWNFYLTSKLLVVVGQDEIVLKVEFIQSLFFNVTLLRSSLSLWFFFSPIRIRIGYLGSCMDGVTLELYF